MKLLSRDRSARRPARCGSRRAGAIARRCSTSDPVELVAELARGGADRLHVVDLDGAFARRAAAARRWSREIVARLADAGRGRRRHPRPRRDRRRARARRRVRRARHRGGALARARRGGVPRASRAASSSRSTRATASSRSTAGRRAAASTAIELGQRAAGWGAAALLYTDVARDGLHVGPNVAATAQLARAVDVRGDRVGRRRRARRSRARCAMPASPRSSSAARSTTGASRSPRPRSVAHGAADARAPDHPVPRRQGRPRRQGHQLRRSCATPAIRSSRPRRTTRRAPTRSASSTSRASPEGRSTLVDVVARTADQVFAPLTVGGGVRTVADAERLLDAGADKIAINTAAIRTPAARRRHRRAVRQPGDRRRGRREAHAATTGWEVFSHGGRTPEGLDALDVVPPRRRARRRRAARHQHGSRRHRRRATTSSWSARSRPRSSIPVIASGGVGELDAPRGRPRGRRRRGARRVDLPLRPAHDRRGEGVPRRRAGSRVRT